LVGTGRANSVLFAINGFGNKQSHLERPPFSVFKACFSAKAGWHFSRVLIASSLIESHILLRMAEITCGNSFESNSPTEQKLVYV